MKNKNTFLRYHPWWLALGWAWIALVVYLSLTPRPPEIDVIAGDKIGHVLAYAFLMLWFAQLYRPRPIKFAIALGLVGLGIAIEFAQQQTGYRSFEVADMGADAVGVDRVVFGRDRAYPCFETGRTAIQSRSVILAYPT